MLWWNFKYIECDNIVLKETQTEENKTDKIEEESEVSLGQLFYKFQVSKLLLQINYR